MKNLFTQSIACISLVIVMSVTINAYSQKAQVGEAKSHTLNKDMLLGKWKIDSEVYTFDLSGTSLVEINGRECPGTWILNKNTLTINPRKLKWRKDDPCSKTKVLQILEITNDKLVTMEKEGEKELYFTKQK